MTLRNGVTVPFVGFGCAFGNWTDNSRFMGFQPELGHFSVAAALRAGYTHFDCAYVYGSHRVVAQHVGQELSKGKKKRSDYFLTTKVCHPWSENALNNIKKTFNFTLIPNCDIRERVFIDFETSLDELSVGYVDLLLMHWPGAFNSIDESVGRTKRRVCWETFEEIYTTGKTRAIGVSNFQVRHLVALLEDTKIVPMVNQIEISPYIQQPEVVSYCMEKDIKLVAWSPFGSGTTCCVLFLIFFSYIFLLFVDAYRKHWCVDRSDDSRIGQEIQQEFRTSDFEVAGAERYWGAAQKQQ